MRTFHCVILAYALLIAGCGYKSMPFWKDDTPKENTQKEPQEVEKK